MKSYLIVPLFLLDKIFYELAIKNCLRLSLACGFAVVRFDAIRHAFAEMCSHSFFYDSIDKHVSFSFQIWASWRGFSFVGRAAVEVECSCFCFALGAIQWTVRLSTLLARKLDMKPDRNQRDLLTSYNAINDQRSTLVFGLVNYQLYYYWSSTTLAFI